MIDEDALFYQQQEQVSRLNEANINTQQYNQTHQSLALQEQEKSMIKEQLDLTEELEMIENLLRGNILTKDEIGNPVWKRPDDSEMIILSEYGIQLIMNTITFYINKNTLLSNYDEETIAIKMEDFTIDLTDTIFMEYEKVFHYPSFEDCVNKLKERIDKKVELRKFAYELIGKNVNEEEIKEQILKEFEGRIEKEIEKIREQSIKNKLKRYSILIREIQDAIHSTYLRALWGQERRTIRQHIHVTESNTKIPTKEGSRVNPFNWVRGR